MFQHNAVLRTAIAGCKINAFRVFMAASFRRPRWHNPILGAAEGRKVFGLAHGDPRRRLPIRAAGQLTILGTSSHIHFPYARFLRNDWRTQGDWTAHYGREYGVLCAAHFDLGFPKLQFYYNPFATSFLLPYAPDLTAYKTPLHFNVKDMTLRRFLTTGMVYQMNPQHFGGTFWQVAYVVRHGKFTGRVEITMQGWPVSASAAAGGPAKQTTAKTK